ncbi:MAG: hypothetical protein GX999_08215, partial [Bacteroidales bacterium]|nr:hypothetical protein [Bacteroidales bacterium]
MNKFWFLNAFLALVFSLNVNGQKYLLQGVVRDSVTNKTLENVVTEVKLVGGTDNTILYELSDIRGRFEISLPAGRYL